MRLDVMMVLVLSTALLAPEAHAQMDGVPLSRKATLLTGAGNDLGWLGAQGELYFAGDRFSAFGGLGYTPEVDGGPAGPTFALGLRAFTAGLRHRGFLELSLSQIATVSGGFDPSPTSVELQSAGQRYYGPGALVGYQYAAKSGFTAMGSIGVGWAPALSDSPSGVSGVKGLLNIGVGYTWR